VRIKTAVLTPVITLVTITALIGTGAALERTPQDGAGATPLESVTTSTLDAPASVAQPAAQSDPVVAPAAPQPVVKSSVQRKTTPKPPATRVVPPAPADAEDESDLDEDD
jgi:hypothetical protein